MDIRLDEQVAIVTGAGQGLGEAIAMALAAAGARVAVNDLNPDLVDIQQNPHRILILVLELILSF